MIIAVGSDHRGFPHKEALKDALTEQGIEVRDCGCLDDRSADYPDAALQVGGLVAASEAQAGILICGSGIGMSIAANKVKGVRASLCFTPEQARTTRQHNDSNVLCLSGDGVTVDQAVEMARVYLATGFIGGRHARRVAKIKDFEEEHLK